MPGKRRAAVNLLLGLDMCLLALSYAAAMHLTGLGRYEASWRQLVSARIALPDLIFFAIVAVVWNRTFQFLGAYESHRLSTFWQQQRSLLQASSVAVVIIGVVSMVTGRNPSAPLLVLLWVFGTASESAARGSIRLLLQSVRRRGRNLRWLVIVGTSERAWEFGQQVSLQRELGYVLRGFIAEASETESRQEGLQVLGHVSELSALLREHVIDEVAISLPMHTHLEQIAAVAQVCRDHGITTRIVAHSVEPHLKISRIDSFGSYGLLTVIPESRVRASSIPKAVFDFSVAACLLVFFAPVLLIIAVIIRLTSSGPIFFSQVRLGVNKRKFHMLKFRTMVADAEAQLAALHARSGLGSTPFKLRYDPRVTRVGRFLRKFSLDELPQLFNVLKGEMSMVGPRPLPISDFEGFKQDQHFRRFSVKPGLSCLWQISGRSDLDFDQWMKLDMEYIDQWSMWLDMKILIKTVPAVIKGDGAY